MRGNISTGGRGRSGSRLAAVTAVRRVRSNGRTAERLGGSVHSRSRPGSEGWNVRINNGVREGHDDKKQPKWPPGILRGKEVGNEEAGYRTHCTYHSPEPSPLRVERSLVLPAAAEAKLDGRGEGIMVSSFRRTIERGRADRDR